MNNNTNCNELKNLLESNGFIFANNYNCDDEQNIIFPKTIYVNQINSILSILNLPKPKTSGFGLSIDEYVNGYGKVYWNGKINDIYKELKKDIKSKIKKDCNFFY